MTRGPAPIEPNDAIQFWQREVYYYEGRAGEQGASATRFVTIAASATAVLALIANTVNAKMSTPNFDVRLVFLLLVVPVLMMLLWSSAIRLLHEMHLLRVYVQRAEAELQKLTTTQPSLDRYTRWADDGLLHDFSFYVMTVWFSTAVVLTFAGTVGIPMLVVVAANEPDKLGLAFFVPVALITILTFSFGDTSSDVSKLKQKFGLPGEESKKPIPAWARVIGLASSAVLVVATFVVIGVLVTTGAQEFTTLGWLGGFIETTAVAGVVLGVLSRDAKQSFTRGASKALVGLALAESIAAIVCVLFGWLGL